MTITLPGGTLALPDLIDGTANTAFGTGALFRVFHSSNNTAVGFAALSGQIPEVTGDDNTAVGHLALTFSTSGTENTRSSFGCSRRRW